MHAAALTAADPTAAVLGALNLHQQMLLIAGEEIRLRPEARLWLIAAGKAARGMAAAALNALPGRITGGVIVHPYGAPLPAGRAARLPRGFVRIEAAHPLPDENSLVAGAEVHQRLAATSPHDLVLVLLSGGASSLLESLVPGLELAELRRVTAALQHAGADVTELNTVRRALSLIKGGGLARLAHPARVVTLALSDVLGDQPEVIGSGPTVASPTSPAEALWILERTGVAPQVPTVVAVLREASAAGCSFEPSQEGIFQVVASNRLAAEAVALTARKRGFRSQIVTTFLQGEACEAGRVVGGCAASIEAQGIPFGPPACLIFGGETTVTVRGSGRGGRNHELALGAALALRDRKRTAVLSFATDGVDGASGAAGALATGETVARAAELGISPYRALADNDSGRFFQALGNHWPGSATGTNVNDLAIALVYP